MWRTFKFSTLLLDFGVLILEFDRSSLIDAGTCISEPAVLGEVSLSFEA